MANTHLSRRSLLDFLQYDPIPPLLSAQDPAVTLLVERDVFGKDVDVTKLWELKEPKRLLKKQQSNGSFLYPTKKPAPFNYDLYETFNVVGTLVGKYGFDKRHPAIEKAVSYMISCQTEEGDFRGIYGRQPAHTYTGAILELLVLAGYANHPSVKRTFDWFLATRQEDGGWAIPARTRKKHYAADEPIDADISKPFSHMVTGMVLRAFAAHPSYRRRRVARIAADLLKSRLFQPDKYTDRRGREFWTKFTYPFGYTDLLTALDSFGRMGLRPDDPQIARAIAWFGVRQNRDGSFDLVMRRGTGDKRLPLWLSLALCRALLRFE